jgi:O-antigen/teichoic acid export membrane protein
MTPKNPNASSSAAFLGTSLSSIVIAVLTFVSGVLIARALGPEARAEYGTVLLIAQTVAALGCLSFFDGAIVELRKSQVKISSALPTMLLASAGISAATTLVAIGILPFLDLGLQDVSTAEFLLITTLMIMEMLLSQCFSAAERSQMNFFLVNVSRITAPATFSLLIGLSWMFQRESLSASLVLILFVVSKLPVLVLWLIRYARQVVGPLSLNFVRDAGKTGLKLHLAIALGVVSGQLDRLIAIGAWPKDLLGQYFVAFSAVGAGYGVITSAINVVLFPYLAGMAAAEREERVSLVIRLTVVVSLGTVVAGVCILPFAVPLLYGAEFLPARSLSIGLLFALAIVPLRAVVLEAGRSLGRGRPAVEMALMSTTVMVGLFFATGFQTPGQLIASLGLANLVSTLAGVRHLVRDGVIRLGLHLIPSLADVRYITASISKR